MLFFERYFMGFCSGALYCSCFGCKRKGSKLFKLYEEGTERLEADLDLDRIILKLKRLDILSKKFLTTKEQRMEVRHDNKNIINLDSSDNDMLEELAKKRKDSQGKKDETKLPG